MLIEVAIVLWRGLSGRAREKVRGRLFFWGWAGTQSLDHCGSCSDTRGGFNRAMAPGGFGFLVMKRVAIADGGWYLVASFCGWESV